VEGRETRKPEETVCVRASEDGRGERKKKDPLSLIRQTQKKELERKKLVSFISVQKANRQERGADA